MKRFLLSVAVCGLVLPCAFPAFAQQANTITIIREDGTKDVIQLGGPPPAVPEPVKRAPKVEVETKPAPMPAPEAVPMPEKAPEAVAEPIVPKIERTAPPVSKPKPKKAVKAKSKPVAKKRPQDPLALIPPRKPHRQVLPAGQQITKDKALYIALAEAPPSRDVQVYSVQGAQGPAYSVLFKTEDGMYEILVDAASGVILQSGTVKVEQGFVKPGHLPVRTVQ